MRNFGKIVAVVIVLVVIIGWSIGPDWRRLILSAPTNPNVLFWSLEQRDAGFRMLDRVSFVVKARTIGTSSNIMDLKQGAPLKIDFDLDAYLEKNRTSGVVILHNGKVRYETYRLGFTETGRWTSFSVGKSFTSTLVGIAIKDGYIKSLNDPVTDYVKDLKGSAYDGVSVEQILTMSSGVAWNEDYEDVNSDVAKFNDHVAEDGLSNLVSYLKQLPRAHPPGDVWNYSTGETNLIGILVNKATGRTLAEYLQEKIWKPIGTQQNATWLLNKDGTEISGCCIQAATRDFARFGQFLLNGAQVDGKSIVPAGWIQNATTTRIRYGQAGKGYGYQWWTSDDGSYLARGIFGQGIFIDPKRNLVIASNSNWTSATGKRNGESAARDAFHQAVAEAIDLEQ